MFLNPVSVRAHSSTEEHVFSNLSIQEVWNVQILTMAFSFLFELHLIAVVVVAAVKNPRFYSDLLLCTDRS